MFLKKTRFTSFEITMYKYHKELDMNLTTILLTSALMGAFTLSMADQTATNTTIDAQISKIQNAKAGERVKLMNAFKQEVMKMNQTDRQAAIQELRAKMTNGAQKGMNDSMQYARNAENKAKEYKNEGMQHAENGMKHAQNEMEHAENQMKEMQTQQTQNMTQMQQTQQEMRNQVGGMLEHEISEHNTQNR